MISSLDDEVLRTEQVSVTLCNKPMQFGLYLISRFLESEERKALCWAINHRDEDDSVIACDDGSFHGEVASSSEEEFQTLSNFIFNP